MKNNKLLSITLALATLICAVIIPANAAEADANEHIEIYIQNENISEETKEKIIAFYTNGGEEKDGATTYGLTCTLFGHKIESSTVTTINHKVRSSAPRCLEKTYDYESCTRCDYEESTLKAQEYIYCC